jgi:hypothetical protein
VLREVGSFSVVELPRDDGPSDLGGAVDGVGPLGARRAVRRTRRPARVGRRDRARRRLGGAEREERRRRARRRVAGREVPCGRRPVGEEREDIGRRAALGVAFRRQAREAVAEERRLREKKNNSRYLQLECFRTNSQGLFSPIVGGLQEAFKPARPKKPREASTM